MTDTNQASEKLRKSVEQCFIKNNMCDCGGEHNALNIDETEYFDVESVVNDVISLIHTEKLKLLDEVRERVIGEDLPPDVATDSGIGYSRQQFAINMGKAGQRRELTKLEAEL